MNIGKAQDVAWVLGVIIGKALFDRISIDCHLNRTILRQLCSSIVFIHDVYSYDKQVIIFFIKLFEAWFSILKEEGVENFFLTFSEMKTFKDGEVKEVDLVLNGHDKPVNDENKREYITKL